MLHVCGVGLQSRCSNSAGWRILLAATGMGWLRGVVAVGCSQQGRVVGLWQFVRRVARAQVGAQSVRKRSWLGRPARASSRTFCFVCPFVFDSLSARQVRAARTAKLGSQQRWRPKGCAAAGGFSVAGRQPGRLGYSAGDSGLVGLVAPGLRGRGQCDTQRFVRRVTFSRVGSQSARRRGLGWDVLPALCARHGFSIHVCFVSSPPARYIPLHLQGELQKEAQSRKEKPLRRDRGAGGLWSRTE